MANNRGVVRSRTDLPEGEVTFLFTDVEGSTRLLERHPAEYGSAIARHHELLANAVERRGGVVFETIGDAVYAAFPDAADAVAAAADGSARAAARRTGARSGELRVRIGLHTGPVERRGDPLLRSRALPLRPADGDRPRRPGRPLRGDRGARSTVLDGSARRCSTSASTCSRTCSTPSASTSWSKSLCFTEFPPLRSAGGVRTTCPPTSKTFVGRQDELKPRPRAPHLVRRAHRDAHRPRRLRQDPPRASRGATACSSRSGTASSSSG